MPGDVDHKRGGPRLQKRSVRPEKTVLPHRFAPLQYQQRRQRRASHRLALCKLTSMRPPPLRPFDHDHTTCPWKCSRSEVEYERADAICGVLDGSSTLFAGTAKA